MDGTNAQIQKEQVRFMKITQNITTIAIDWGAHAPPRAGDGALAIANFFFWKRVTE